MNIALEYIKYRWNAKRRHGIHSPFIYDLTDKCLEIEYIEADKKLLKNLYSSLTNDNRTIEFSDFGVGSKKLGNKRSVAGLFKQSSSKGKFGKFFYQLARHYEPNHILEFGTSLGIGSIHFALGNRSASIVTVEACPETYKLAKENFTQLNIPSIEVINSTFVDFIDTNRLTQKFDIIFIDGHHDGISLLSYLEAIESSIHDDTFIIIDDIRWSNSMYAAWNELIARKEFHVSIDFFRMGIIIKRPKQVKEHFTLRF